MFYYDKVNKDNRALTQNVFISNKTLKVYPQPLANSNCPFNGTSKVQKIKCSRAHLSKCIFSYSLVF